MKKFLCLLLLLILVFFPAVALGQAPVTPPPSPPALTVADVIARMNKLQVRVTALEAEAAAIMAKPAPVTPPVAPTPVISAEDAAAIRACLDAMDAAVDRVHAVFTPAKPPAPLPPVPLPAAAPTKKP